MSVIKLNKITSDQISAKGIQALADRPNANAQYGVGGLSSTQLKLRFDKLATFLAEKINELQTTLASDEAADYIRIPLERLGVASLKDIVDSFVSGAFADKLLQVYASATAEERCSLQAFINNITKELSHIKENVSKKEDTSSRYEKTVPAGVGKYALVKSIIISKTIKNELNPASVSFSYSYDGMVPISLPAPLETTVNDDGSLTVRTHYHRATTTIRESQLSAGKYYLHIECDNEFNIFDHGGYLNISLKASSSFGDTFNIKMMLWKYEDSDTVEITEAPVGTEFVPYLEGFKNVAITRIESVGADGVTMLGTLNIPDEVQILDGYGREGTCIEWNDDGTITVTVTKDADLNDLSSPNVVDVTNYFVDSNVIEVEESGIIRSVNNFNYPVTTTIIYTLNVVDSLILAGREKHNEAVFHEISNRKLDKTIEAMKLYGTDANGNQKMYNAELQGQASGVAIRVDGGYINQPNPTQNWHGSNKEYTDQKDNEVKAYADSRINPLEERVSELESLKLTFSEDISTDYEKTVPAEVVGKYALVKMIGGATEKVLLTKNMLNPRDIDFYTMSGAELNLQYNNDGTITYTTPTSVTTNGAYGAIYFGDFPMGRYYVYAENAKILIIDNYNVDLDLYDSYECGITRTIKVMVWQDTSVTTDTYEIVEAPADTVFEPYTLGFQDAEVERIESVGADGETLLDLIAIPVEAIKAKIDGFGEMVNDTYYDYIEFVDDKVFGYKVADEIVLNGTETWTNNGDMTSPNNYYVTIVTSDKTKYVSGQISSDRYDFFDLGTSNREVGIDAYVSEAFGGFAVGVRPPNVESYSVTKFREEMAANPITVRLALKTPEVTDITDLFTDSNKLQVQQGGAIRFVNEKKMAIPNTVAFIKRKE